MRWPSPVPFTIACSSSNFQKLPRDKEKYPSHTRRTNPGNTAEKLAPWTAALLLFPGAAVVEVGRLPVLTPEEEVNCIAVDVVSIDVDAVDVLDVPIEVWTLVDEVVLPNPEVESVHKRYGIPL